MPKCKNDPTKSYKGIEPSPKGLGWCGHGENIGTRKKGKDKNMWVVKKTKDGKKRWVKEKNGGSKPIQISKVHVETFFKPNIYLGDIPYLIENLPPSDIIERALSAMEDRGRIATKYWYGRLFMKSDIMLFMKKFSSHYDKERNIFLVKAEYGKRMEHSLALGKKSVDYIEFVINTSLNKNTHKLIPMFYHQKPNDPKALSFSLEKALYSKVVIETLKGKLIERQIGAKVQKIGLLISEGDEQLYI